MIIKNGRIIDPASGMDKIADIKIEDGKIVGIGKFDEVTECINAENLIVAPGLVDIHVHFRDPGFTEKEDIFTGSEAAAAGGFTSVVCMGNTKPVMDNINTLEYFLDKAKKSPIHVYTIAALTLGFKNEKLSDMRELVKRGCVGFSDDGIPNTDTKLILEGMMIAKELDVPISFHEEDPMLNRENGVNHGKISDSMGLYGAPSVSEDVLVARDGAMCLYTGAKIDIQHISSGEAVDIVRFYRNQGANLFAEVTPHHFSCTEDLILEKGTLAKMNPPLRTSKDREKIIQGLVDDTITIIATDHAPHTEEEKNRDFLAAPSGIIGLETALSLGITNLVKTGKLSLIKLLEKMTVNPARLYNLSAGKIEIGAAADIVIFDENEEYVVGEFRSKAKNSPFIGEKLFGKIKYTIADGKIVYKN
ncbi:dihydroorotase [Peptoniphilus sp. oral taxon 386]|uniref:dihydroorotase n=1 Tax=Peptoniphilus sp. oral taxon 386 TaxID=652713 RepID=UPI000313C093|nr:dihydroorotase [Peptoniphilus sp. oral taxon 386]